MTEPTRTSELREDDILLGRGSGPSKHPGNARFRAIVQETYDEHMATERAKKDGSSKLDGAFQGGLRTASRAHLVKVIREKTREQGCRFLQKVNSPPGTNPHQANTDGVGSKGKQATASKETREPDAKINASYYQQVEEKQIREKIKQALRFVDEKETGRYQSKQTSRSIQYDSPSVASLRPLVSTPAPNPLLQGNATNLLQQQQRISPNSASFATLLMQGQGLNTAALPGYPMDQSDEGHLQRLLLLKIMEENRQAEARLQETMRAIAIQRILNQAQLAATETMTTTPPPRRPQELDVSDTGSSPNSTSVFSASSQESKVNGAGKK